MKKKIITSKTKWEEKYAFSQGIQCENVKNILFLAGQASIDENGNVAHKGDIKAQTQLSLENIRVLLEKTGFKLSDVVQENIYLTDMKYLKDVIEVRKKFWKNNCPANSVIGVKCLGLDDLMIEIAVIATK